MSLRVSEIFYSCQCEGATTGVPAVFIRLTGCNLMCGGPGGSLVKEGKATWWCDTEVVWKLGKEYSNQDFVDKFKEFGQLENVLSGRTHLIWTGGEPTMPQHVKGITEFLDWFDLEHGTDNVFNEIETNGSLIVPDEFYANYIDQINCSAKLSNSGMPASMRINEKAIKQVIAHPRGYLKFVISVEEDVLEFEKEYVEPFNIPYGRVILMPGLDKQEDAAERTRFVYDMAKKFGYRAVTRGHVIAWGRLTGV